MTAEALAAAAGIAIAALVATTCFWFVVAMAYRSRAAFWKREADDATGMWQSAEAELEAAERRQGIRRGLRVAK